MSRTIDVRNPRTGEMDYQFTPPTPAEVSCIAAELRANNGPWQALGVEGRIAALQAWRRALQEHQQSILEQLVIDTGRRRISQIEFDGVLSAIDRWSRLAPELLAAPEWMPTSLPSVQYKTQFVPYELVGAISPWNFPLTLSLIDALPALFAGCSVIIKPSEIAPRFAEPLQASIKQVKELAGVLAIRPGGAETGAALIDEVDAICFTGSVKIGRSVGEAAARRFIPSFLELGGKDPAIVTDTANLEQAVNVVLRASVLATGQACQSIERVYVQSGIYQDFLAALVRAAKQVRLSYPDLNCGEIGPFISHQQAEVITVQLADAVKRGAQILCGGEIRTYGGGRWLEPTVLINVNHQMQLMREETFGPIIPVMPFDTISTAISYANDSQYGLSAAVLAGTIVEAEAIALLLNVGAISLNDGSLTGIAYEAEKNSFKVSGLGASRMGAAGLQRFLRKKALLAQRGLPAPLSAFSEVMAN